ncbi:MAG: AgmX/PglI C-terminal domain-containing protein [Pseudomonadota bacterium]
MVLALTGLGVGSTFAATLVAHERQPFRARPLGESIASRLVASYAVDPIPPTTRPQLQTNIVAAVFEDARTARSDPAAPLPGFSGAALDGWHKQLQIGIHAPHPATVDTDEARRAAEAEAIARLQAQRREQQRRQQLKQRGVETDVLTRQIMQRTRVLRACYERYLKTHSQAEGRLRIELSIDDSGTVDEVKVLTDSFEGSEVRDCLTERMRRWRFAAPAGGAFRVVVPIAFTRRR